MYENSSYNRKICRAENIRFKAAILRMPSNPVDWHKVEMRNWNQYNREINGIKVQINLGNRPTIGFIPGPIDGDNIDSLRIQLLQDCTAVAQELEDRLHMKIGRLELSSKGEWIVYDPVAKAFSKRLGQVTIKGIGKANASGPARIGEFEFNDPRDCAEYMAMPRRLYNVEQQQSDLKDDIREIKNLLKEMNSMPEQSKQEGEEAK